MTKLSMDGREVEVAPGATILDAAHALGIEIPTLCHLDGHPPYASCMVCAVRDEATGKLLPSCAAPAVEGMRIAAGDEAVRRARRETLELLLSEHLGDCEGPCRRACPANMDIPRMIREIAAGDFPAALVTVRRRIPFPSTLGRICSAPCEKACRRRRHDAAVSICLLKRFVGDLKLGSDAPLPSPATPTGRRVAIVGAGPAGLTAAYYLLLAGHAVTVYDDHPDLGGMLRYGVPEDLLGREVLDAEIEVIRRLGLEFRPDARVGRDVSFDELAGDADAVVLAVGAIEASDAEAFAVEPSRLGIRAERQTLATSREGVFAGGDAVRAARMAVKAVGDGYTLAESIGRYLVHGSASVPHPRFNCQIGRLVDGEMTAFLEEADPRARVEPAADPPGGFTADEARAEAARCLHCDCRAACDCDLRKTVESYRAAQPKPDPATRRRFRQLRQHPDVLFEPGKCVKCARCIRIAEREGEALGLSFIGRGYDAEVGVPFEESLDRALRVSASACVEACPTGALAYLSSE